MKLYFTELVVMFPGHVGQWECRTPLAPGYCAYGATEREARRRAVAHVRDHVKPRLGL